MTDTTPQAKGLRDFRVAAYQRVLRGDDARDVSREYCDHILAWIADIWSAHIPEGIAAVLAITGGVGRGDAVWGSDIDYVVLTEDAAVCEPAISAVHQACWDAGGSVSGAVRSQQEVRALFREGDVRSQTALLEMRYCSGNRDYWNSAQQLVTRATATQLWRRHFVQAKQDEQAQRRARYGGSPFFLEPNIKSSEGGLRDWHTLCWIGRALGHLPHVDAIFAEQWMTSQECCACQEAIRFMLQMRWALHGQAQRAEDRFGFHEQAQLASLFRETAIESHASPELLMQHYYQSAACIRDVSNWLTQRWVAPCPRRVQWYLRATSKRWCVFRAGVVVRTDHGWPMDDAVAVIRDAASTKLPLHASARRALRVNAPDGTSPVVSDELRNVRQLLALPEVFARFTRELHRTGWLASVFPEFSHLHYRAQRDAYHCVTIDVHLLRTVQHCADLLSQEASDDLVGRALQHARETLRGEYAPLMLAALMHDVGKGTGQPHAEVGEAWMRERGAMYGLDERETMRAAFLVRLHQTMPALAFGRDLQDAKLIERFTESMESRGRLASLYLLSVADLQSVGPQVYTPWKAELLAQLYQLSMAHMNAEASGDDVAADASVDSYVARVCEQSDGMNESQVYAWIRSMPYEYRRNNEAVVRQHVRWWCEDERGACHTHARKDHDGMWTLDVVTHDRPGVFAACCAVFAAHGVSIIEARAFTGHLSNVVDRFRCAVRSDTLLADPHGPVQQAIHDVLRGAVDPAQLYAQRRPSLLAGKARVVKAPKVSVDNTIAEDRTVIDVHASDRIGLLYELSACIVDAGYTIVSAKILTVGDRVRDAFYVRDGQGQIRDEAACARVRSALQSIAEDT